MGTGAGTNKNRVFNKHYKSLHLKGVVGYV